MSKKIDKETRRSWHRRSCIRVGLIPVAYSAEAGGYTETNYQDFTRARCMYDGCNVTWNINQGEYIRRHMQKHHGRTFADMLQRWYGGPVKETA